MKLSALIPQDPTILARRYREQAAILRRRAVRNDATDEQYNERTDRALWYEARAECLERGPNADPLRPPGQTFPRELRTPIDSLRMVDEFRHDLALLLARVLDEIDHQEVQRFRAALELTAEADVEWFKWLDATKALLHELGWTIDGWRDPEVELAMDPDSEP